MGVLCLAWPAATVWAGLAAPAPLPVLKGSDVVFMYGTGADVYREYGATVLGWGGTPTAEGLGAAREAGVLYFGSVGMVTEFAQFIDEFPQYETVICVDVQGNRLRVPWLWDHSHNGVPAYWFCTSQPLFREYLRRRVVEVVQGGADGVHVDDHLGTAGNSWLGGCYCDRCVAGFRDYVAAHATAQQLADAGISRVADLDYRQVVLDWLAAHPDRKDDLGARPLAALFATYQSQAAAAFMAELRALAAETAGRPVPMSANVGVPNLAQMSDYQALDMFCCEVDQRAGERRGNDGVVVAYRLAEALQRPVAATASGWDWAFIKEQNLPGLVRLWIVQAYALGQHFMVPHHQWCYTQEKGTHWYDGPPGEYAWLFRFVRDHAALFDGYEPVAEVGVVLAARAQRQGQTEAADAAVALAGANVPFRMLVAGDEQLPADLSEAQLAACPMVVAPHADLMDEKDRAVLDRRAAAGGVLPWGSAEALLAAVPPAVRVEGAPNLWVLPRVRPADPGAPIVVQLVNRNYDAATDSIVPVTECTIALRASLWGGRGVRAAVLHQPRTEPQNVTLETVGEWVSVPLRDLSLWGVLELQ